MDYDVNNGNPRSEIDFPLNRGNETRKGDFNGNTGRCANVFDRHQPQQQNQQEVYLENHRHPVQKRFDVNALNETPHENQDEMFSGQQQLQHNQQDIQFQEEFQENYRDKELLGQQPYQQIQQAIQFQDKLHSDNKQFGQHLNERKMKPRGNNGNEPCEENFEQDFEVNGLNEIENGNLSPPMSPAWTMTNDHNFMVPEVFPEPLFSEIHDIKVIETEREVADISQVTTAFSMMKTTSKVEKMRIPKVSKQRKKSNKSEAELKIGRERQQKHKEKINKIQQELEKKKKYLTAEIEKLTNEVQKREEKQILTVSYLDENLALNNRRFEEIRQKYDCEKINVHDNCNKSINELGNGKEAMFLEMKMEDFKEFVPENKPTGDTGTFGSQKFRANQKIEASKLKLEVAILEYRFKEQEALRAKLKDTGQAMVEEFREKYFNNMPEEIKQQWRYCIIKLELDIYDILGDPG